MDNMRFVLVVLLGFILYQLSIYWEYDYGPKKVVPIVESTQSDLSQETVQVEDLPSSSTDPTNILSEESHTEEIVSSIELAEKTIKVSTDKINLEIDSSGSLILLDMLEYPVEKETPDIPLKLLNNTKIDWFIAQSGFRSAKGFAPNHHSVYQFDKEDYQLAPGENQLIVPLRWTNDFGIEVVSTFIFNRGSHAIELEQVVKNNSDRVWSGGQYNQLQRVVPSGDTSMFIRTYTGGVLYTEDQKYEKVSFDDMRDEKLSRDTKGGWSAMIQHYFLAAWVPPESHKNRFYSIALPDNVFVIGSYGPQFDVQPGSERMFSSTLYAGPKIQKEMEKTAQGLELTVDYGVLTFIGKPIFWLLDNFHEYVKNWGVAIMLVTLVIKAIFFKLSEKSYRSMAKMRRLQPKLQAIKERYEDDKPRFNQEMMNLYRAEKVNPLGGCLPILVQIPVFISLYWVLIETVELRHAPFMLWIDDLSVKDPFFILPLLMGVSMWIQQRLNPTPVDPIQEKVMKLFPIIFTVFFLFFPAGLVLYWVVNNSLSICQQWYITRSIERGYSTE